MPEAVAIGIAKFNENGFPEVCYYKEFKPCFWVDLEALSVHGLSNQYLVDKDRFKVEDAQEINDLLEGCKACFAHNAAFDRMVLDHEFHLVGKVFLPRQNM
mgnify:CR=1 FL=1